MMYKVFECINIYQDSFFGPHDVWTERGGFVDFEAAKEFADQLIDHELCGPEFDGTLIRYSAEIYGEDEVLVEYGASLAYRPMPFGSKGFFIVKTP